PLPRRAVVARAAGLHDLADAERAHAAGAFLAGAAVDRPLVLKIAELARGLDVVAQGRAARRDGALQHVADRRGEPLGARASHRASEAARAEAGPEQAFGDVDVAEPGDDALVEKRGLQGRAPSGEPLLQHGARELVAERLRAELLEELVIEEPVVGDEVHRAEAARVVEADLGTVLENEDDMVVRIARDGRGRLDQNHPPRHAEMDEESLAAVEVNEDVLGAAAESLDAPPFEPLAEPGRQRKAEIGTPLLDAGQTPPLHPERQSAPHGFDFG